MQAFDLAVQPGKVAVVDHDVVGMAHAILATGLGLEDRLDLLLAGLVTLQGTFDLQLFGGIDHQHPLGHGVLPGLDQQRRNQNRIRRFCQRQVVSDFFADQRMQEGLQPAAFFWHFEDQFA
ncbi:hypothetical protein D9M71_284950 [compost metagenome]